MRSLLTLLFSSSLLLSTLHAQKFEHLADTPPMGWNSWNYFNCDGINENVIKEVADAMVSSGMRDAGYAYIVMDDCWQTGRDAGGTIIADPDKFPSGMKALADYIHSKGLKFGLYSDAGRQTCQKRPGSRGYEYQDARTYASWGVDYLKYDWCNTGDQNPVESYTLMRDALYQAGRPVVFSICEWGLGKPWLWASDVGHLWRTTGDIRNNWTQPDAKEGKVWGGGVLIILDMQQGLEQFAGPGHWNDPDMLEIGNGVLTPAEERAHFSLWCMLAAPLMAGNDLRTMNDLTRSILTNPGAITIDQDPLGKQGFKLKDEGLFEIWKKELDGGNYAFCFLNRGEEALDYVIHWKDLDITNGYTVENIWYNENETNTDGTLSIRIHPHDVVLLRLTR
ncbi:MAG TPA: glycoside hydrolase family 27 protein [Bacteroidales bacterium]|nr:glycoside hydrolase family 27 protein [Bacteroidales bacterium]